MGEGETEGETGGGIFGDCVGRSRRETDRHTLSYPQMCKNCACACVCVCLCLCLFLCRFVSVGLRERKIERGRKVKEGERGRESPSTLFSDFF